MRSGTLTCAPGAAKRKPARGKPAVGPVLAGDLPAARGPHGANSTRSAEWSDAPLSRTAWSNAAPRSAGAQAGERKA